MKAKDKTKKHIKITLKNVIYFLAFVIIVLYLYTFYDIYFSKNKSYARQTSSDVEEFKISNASKINIDDLINENTNDGQKEEFTTQEVELEFITKYENNADLPKGVIQVIQEGREGKQQITTKKTYKNTELISEEQVGAKVTKASINKIVQVGSGKSTSNYKVKVGDTVYVTADRLAVMSESNEQSEKITTLTKSNELKVEEIQNGWYKIICGTTRGYVKAESTTYINPNSKYEESQTDNSGAKTKQQLTANLSIDMTLNKPSGLTLDQFKKVLSDSKDTNKILENNAEYFYYIEKQYNINGIFVASVAIHESAWGTSKIARDKNNLFGYGAYDSNPYNGAYSFSNYSESIDLIARVFVKYYLNPKGTSIYGGETAAGTYYNGATLNGINTKYATDKNWANAVYTYIKYLYNKL